MIYLSQEKQSNIENYRILVICPCHTEHENGLLIAKELQKYIKPEIFCVNPERPLMNNLIEKNITYKPDWILVTGVKTFSGQIISHLKKYTNARWCLWDADNNPQLSEAWNNIKGCYNLIFCSRTYTAKHYQDYANKVIWIPQYCADDYHGIYEETDTKIKYDVGFVGNAYGDKSRIKVLDMLNKKYKLAVAGEFPPYSTKQLRGKEMRDFVRQCKIHLDITRDPSIFTSLKEDNSISDRIYKVMGCGGFFMSYCKISGAHELQDGRDYIYYSDEQDLFNKIDYYLKEPEERIKIAQQGKQTVKKYHVLSRRIHEYVNAMHHYDNKIDFIYSIKE